MTTRTPLPHVPGLHTYVVGNRIEFRCDDCRQVIVWRWVPKTDVDAARGAHRCPATSRRA